MKHSILIKKYQEIKDEIAHCIPDGSTLKELDGNSVLVQTPDRTKKKEVLHCCRNAVGNTKEVLIQPVIHYTETNRGFELTVPEMRIFLSKQRN